MKRQFTILLSSLFLLTAGCFNPSPPVRYPTTKKNRNTEAQFARWARNAPNVKLSSPQLTRLVASNNQFAFDLYHRLAKRKAGNVVFSPFSISDALAMTFAGAKGDTAAEMKKTLRFTLTPTELHRTFAGLLVNLKGRANNQKSTDIGRTLKLDIANALWLQKGFPFRQEYLNEVEKNYYAGFEALDFAQTDDARQTINRWVEKRTNNKIKDLLQPGDISAATRLVLTNAIYFNGEWRSKFDKNNTQEQPFATGPGKKSKVPMMQQHGEFAYFENADFQLLNLYYRGRPFSMAFLLPKKRHALDAVEKSLTAQELHNSINQMRSRPGSVFIPRFKFNFRVSLNDELSAMGMPIAFTGPADLSGVTTAENLYIGNVIHQAFLEVNEKGTEAAAATAVDVVKSKPKEKPPPPFTFRADQPFLFAIVHYSSGTILFLGRVRDPADF